MIGYLTPIKITKNGKRVYSADEHEQKAIDVTLEYIEARADRHPNRTTNWGVKFENRKGNLPLAEDGAYLEFFVNPTPGVKGVGERRIMINRFMREVYYTSTHYGDTGSPAFVKLIGQKISGIKGDKW